MIKWNKEVLKEFDKRDGRVTEIKASTLAIVGAVIILIAEGCYLIQ